MRDTDWSAPWFAAVADDARRIDWSVPARALAALNARAAEAGLSTGAGQPLGFADSAGIQAEAYEAHIARSGQVPTRLEGDGWVHDALNALAWLRFPRIKAALNAVQAGALARDGVRPVRGALRDAATLFDENALLLPCAAPGLADALRARRWRELLHDARADWGRRIDAIAFGHALMQKLRAPFKAITAHAWIIEVEPGWFDLPVDARLRVLDARVSVDLRERLPDRAARAPLPVLGIPGWWPANADPAFLDDATVFRPTRQRET